MGCGLYSGSSSLGRTPYGSPRRVDRWVPWPRINVGWYGSRRSIGTQASFISGFCWNGCLSPDSRPCDTPSLFSADVSIRSCGVQRVFRIVSRDGCLGLSSRVISAGSERLGLGVWVANAILILVFPNVQHASSVRFFYIFALMMVLQMVVI